MKLEFLNPPKILTDMLQQNLNIAKTDYCNSL